MEDTSPSTASVRAFPVRCPPFMRAHLCRTGRVPHSSCHFMVDRPRFIQHCPIAGYARREAFGCDSSHGVTEPLSEPGCFIIA